MGLPNATSILSTLPGGLRATVSRGSVVASLAVRTAINEAGQLSLGGLERMARNNIWTLVADFTPRVKVGDVLTVNGVPAFVVDAMTSCGNLVSRAQVVLCEDSVTTGELVIPCHLGLLGQDVEVSLGGFLPDDVQGFFVPESILPSTIGDDGEAHLVEIAVSTQVLISGETFNVEKVARDSRHDVLCVTCRRRGAA